MTNQAKQLPDLSVKDTAKLLNCSPKHCWVMIREGALRSYKVGRIVRIPRESIDYLREHGYDRHRSTVA